jgi:NAD(P)-dependent dehydrogenase (short-subunit alcohol dehydrogenase family)
LRSARLLETTRELARHGAHVIMAVRNLDKGATAAGHIRAQIPDARLELRHLDLADLDSVRAFAAGDLPALDLLINNAGVMMPPLTRTQQGFELQIGANHLGHFALTALLWPHLASTPAARVVTVSSNMHKRGAIDFDDLSYTSRPYTPIGAYAQSKFANVLFALELDRRLRAAKLPAASLARPPRLRVHQPADQRADRHHRQARRNRQRALRTVGGGRRTPTAVRGHGAGGDQRAVPRAEPDR